MMVCQLALPHGVHLDRVAMYLEDHLGRMAHVRDRTRRYLIHDQGAPWAHDLGRVVDAIVDDHHTLCAVMAELGMMVPPSGKPRIARIDGGAARQASYSPYSRIVELEFMMAGARARAGMWACLDGLFADDPDYDGDFAWRALRAEEEAERLERRRMDAALAFWRRPARAAS